MSQTERGTGLTQEDWRRIRKFNEMPGANEAVLRGTLEREKKIECVACGTIAKVPKKSVKSYCYDCRGQGRNSKPDTEENRVQCIDCGEWYSIPEESSSSMCDDCRGLVPGGEDLGF